MRLNQYLNEGRSVAISEKEAAEFIKEECKSAWSNTTRIYRGNRGIAAEYYFLDPSKSHDRRSPFASNNFYNLIVSNLPAWKEYPKRSKSIICTTDSRNARRRGYGVYYFVLPVDNAKIGICPDEDIWDSFYTSDIELGNFGYYLDEFFELNKIFVSDNDYNNFKFACKKIDDLKKDGKLIIRSNLPQWLKDFEYEKVSFFDYIEGLLNPKRNLFKLTTIEHMTVNDHREVWTDSKSILIRVDETIIGDLLQIHADIEKLDNII